MNFYEVYSNHSVPSTVNNYDEIGPAFNFSIKVSSSSVFSKPDLFACLFY